MLEQLQKESVKNEGAVSEAVKKAIEVVRRQMSRGNDFIAIDSIKECPVNLADQGSFIMREKFNVIKPKKFEAVLFLFDRILVFTTVDHVTHCLILTKTIIFCMFACRRIRKCTSTRTAYC